MNKNLSSRADNRRMTGNVNIYICSESSGKGKNGDVNVNRSNRSESSEKFISSRQFNDTSSHDFRTKIPNEILTGRGDGKKVDISNVVSCRCPRFDESDQWLRRFAKRKAESGESFNVESNGDDKVMNETKQRKTGDENKCTCYKDSTDKACDPLCTCCCIEGIREKAATNSVKIEIGEKKVKEKRKKKEKSKKKSSDKSDNSKSNDNKESSFFSRFFGMLRSKKDTTKLSTDKKKEGVCNPDCTGLKVNAKKTGKCSPECTELNKNKAKAAGRMKAGGCKAASFNKRAFNDTLVTKLEKVGKSDKIGKIKDMREQNVGIKSRSRDKTHTCTSRPSKLEIDKKHNSSQLCFKCLDPEKNCACRRKSLYHDLKDVRSKKTPNDEFAYQRSNVFPHVVSELRQTLEKK